MIDFFMYILGNSKNYKLSTTQITEALKNKHLRESISIKIAKMF